VVRVVIVVIDGLLHEPQAERIHAEIQIGLRLIDGRRHMMQSDDRVRHVYLSSVPEGN
jgi:hypothetical protein